MLASAAAAVLALALVAVPTALANGAHGDEVHLEVHAQEGDDCTGSDLCFQVNRSSVPAEQTINVTVFNEENNTQSHSYYFDWTGDHDHSENPDTPESAAEAQVTTRQPNRTGFTEFTIPADAASELYIWCDEPAHETAGMHTALDITGLAGDGGTGDGDGTGDGNQPTPGFGVLAAMAAAGVGAALLSRRD